MRGLAGCCENHPDSAIFLIFHISTVFDFGKREYRGH